MTGPDWYGDAQYKRELATIRKASICSDDHGNITCWLHVDYDSGSSQGVGGYSLGMIDPNDFDPSNPYKNTKLVGTAFGMSLILGFMQVVGCAWEDMPGHDIVVLFDENNDKSGWGPRPLGVQNRKDRMNKMIFSELVERFALPLRGIEEEINNKREEARRAQFEAETAMKEELRATHSMRNVDMEVAVAGLT